MQHKLMINNVILLDDMLVTQII